MRPAEEQFGPNTNRLADRIAQAEAVTAVREQVRLYRDALRTQRRTKLERVLDNHAVIVLGMHQKKGWRV